MPSTELAQALKALRLSGMLPDVDERVAQAVQANLAYDELLLQLCTDELERRHARKLNNTMQKAKFSSLKEFEDFDFDFNPSVPKRKIADLCTANFVATAKPVILCGPTGVGKSHLAQAIGKRVVRKGYKVVFSDARELFQSLRAAKADHSYEEHFHTLVSVDLLILDDLGLHPLKSDEAYDLYDLIRKRHEIKSTMITSNRLVSEWGGLFPDPLIASAALDRILENAEVLILEGRSYRAANRRPRRGKNEDSGSTE